MKYKIVRSLKATEATGHVIVGTIGKSPAVDAVVKRGKLKLKEGLPGKEGFVLDGRKGRIVVAGGDDSGTLYGCLELAERVREEKRLPGRLHFCDAPKLSMRGTCIGMQKTSYLPGRRVYEYPYTPETFPFFYDKEHWKKYLDFLVENRMNALYLWNGHPFASLVRLEDYPYAVEVSEETFARNVEMYNYITTEADKRGIWVIQMFYNIIVSK
ncbi:MAG: beta-N-acetylhexosaminidase family protein, partial [Planctomycetota bacterium]